MANERTASLFNPTFLASLGIETGVLDVQVDRSILTLPIAGRLVKASPSITTVTLGSERNFRIRSPDLDSFEIYILFANLALLAALGPAFGSAACHALIKLYFDVEECRSCCHVVAHVVSHFGLDLSRSQIMR